MEQDENGQSNGKRPMNKASDEPRPMIPMCDTEPVEGRYFVATYPPFSCFSKEQLDDYDRLLQRPCPAAADHPFGLYVHIPFCAKRCDFCYYLSYQGRARDIGAYVDALAQELRRYGACPALAGRPLEFVYFGGGTPSLLSTGQINTLLERLQVVFPWTDVREATFECAPMSVSADKLQALRTGGISRLSLGVQQFDDAVLQRNGRIHLVEDVETAYGLIRDVGFDVVNIDLIAGLVGERDDSFFGSLERTIELAPDSVTIYLLEMPQNTPLYHHLGDEPSPASIPTWPVKRERLGQAFARLEEAGYEVISAYTAVRDRRRHRFVYQEDQYRGVDLLGIGAASFSYVDGTHHQNVASLDGYLRASGENRLPFGRAHVLSDNERLVREFVLQLKLGSIDVEWFEQKFGRDVRQVFAAPLTEMVRQGWMSVDEKRVTMTRSGLLRVDRLLPAFYPLEHRNVRDS